MSKPAGIAFSTFAEYFRDFHPHLALYGGNGTGKTTFAVKTGLRTLHIDCGDAGVMTLRDYDKKKFKVIRVRSITHYLDVIEKAQMLADQIDVLVVDTVQGLQSMAIREVKGKRNFEMNQRKWGAVSSRVIECIAETRTFPKDIIYLAQQKTRTIEEVDHYAPSIQPASMGYLSSCVDWVGRIYLEDDRRKLSFILSDTVEAKDRSNLFPKVIVMPNNHDVSIYPQLRKRILENIHD